MAVLKFSWFTWLGVGFLLLDIALDILAAVKFYEEKAYVSLAFLVSFLLGSSVLVQVFSWLWYSYDSSEERYPSQKYLSPIRLKLIHCFQLGIYLRYVDHEVICLQTHKTEDESEKKKLQDSAAYLKQDLSTLRLIEAFSENAPQLVLMLSSILRKGQFDPVTVLKALGSAIAIVISVTMYHRSLRSFLKGKAQQQIRSSILYFLWNLILIMSRLVALALFASVLPCYIISHFFCSWVVLLFIAWRCKTDFMDSPGGEWLYRATVGLIWYFNWFNVTDGRTRVRMAIYHGYRVADISLLCGLWCWKMIAEEQQIHMSDSAAIITAVTVVVCYVLGLSVKLLYYTCLHPTLRKEEVTAPPQPVPLLEYGRGPDHTTIPQPTCQNERMRKMAENFFTS